MAYGAVCCLELTIDRLLKSSHISIVQNSSPQILKRLYDEILSLTEALGEFDTRRSTINMKMVKSFEVEMIDAVYQFEDVIEPYLSNQFVHPQSEEEEEDSTDRPPSMLFSVDLEEIQQDIDSFIETVKKMTNAYIQELRNPSPEDEEDVAVPLRVDFGGNESNMVGSSHLFTRIKNRLNSSQSKVMIVSLVGMAGIGKTALANKVFHDPFISNSYDVRVFLTIGPKYRLAKILVDILTQVCPDPDIYEVVVQESEKALLELKTMVAGSLRNLRYLIVFDDVWDRELLYNLFPNHNNGSRVLLTTRIEEVGQCAYPPNTFRMPYLGKKESWDFLREKVGEQEPFSFELERAGRKIAENCEGLPLTIVTVANILSKADRTTEYWNEVADDKQHSVYKDAYDQMSNVLYPSYDYLDQYLKACFLYIGGFPQSYRVYGHQLTTLWGAEGFLNSKPIHYLDPTTTSTDDNYDNLEELYVKNVIMFKIEDRSYYLHSSFWYLCNKEAAKNRLFYAFNNRGDALPEKGINHQRRLCIRNSVLLAIADVHNSIASASKVRSLLCTGPYHEYPVPLCLEHVCAQLRVLHASGIRFYEFPMEVLKLIQLRYFALTCDENLPTSISKLLNLLHLIVEQHLRIVKTVGNQSYLPIEIWNMKELKSLKTTGRDLQRPLNCEGSLLPNLLTLTGVGPQSCTKYVLEKIPYLKELLIKIDLPPDAAEQLSCFDHISHLHELELLECDIVNPVLKTEVATPLTPLSDFPSSLKVLTLSGLGYPWEQMSKISSLPNLKDLKLLNYAFRGPKWEVHNYEFQKLLYLEIQDSDLVQWKFVTKDLCLPAVRILEIEHCYKLEEIPLTFGTSLRTLLVVDCNPMVGNCAKMLKQDRQDRNHPLVVSVQSSWDDANI